jgi:hypothetical protein
VSIIRKCSYPEAPGNSQRISSQTAKSVTLQLLVDLGGKYVRSSFFRVRKDYNELVATVSGSPVGLAYILEQNSPHICKKLAAGKMSVGIVDILETIEIKKYQ